jgi:transglutaminase-like putative cysteine protease
MKILVMFSLCILSFQYLYGKEDKVKFGKIDKADLEMTLYEKDSSAAAVILYEYGSSEIEYDQNTGWKLVFFKHQRIKILKKEGVDYADFQVRLYQGNSEKEELGGLKAITFNLEKGKVVKSELDKNDVHLEEVNKFYMLKSFTLPNVKVGSVIDVKYQIDCKSFFRNMRPWMFQHEIPTIYSEYDVSIPEYFHFRKFTLGFETYSTFDETKTVSSVSITETTRPQTSLSGTVAGTISNETVRFNNNNYHWIAEEMPAFVEEAYVSTVDNYIQQVQFELQTAQFPQSKLYTYSSSWESINTDLIEDEDFGRIVFGPVNSVSDITSELLIGAGDDAEKVSRILNYVHANYKYNGSRSIYSKGVRKVVKDGNGNVADLNFLLAAMLRTAGFDVKPVLLSTRSNGKFIFPTVTGFNYVVIQCDVAGTKVLLDAADKYCGVNQVPFYCLNGDGLVVGGNKPEWVDFYGMGTSEICHVSEITIGSQGEITGKLEVVRKGYAASNFREKVEGFVSTDKYFENFAEGKSSWEIEDHTLENCDNLNEKVTETINLTINNKSLFTGDRIYLSPIVFNPETENPFKLKERKYPVDFGCKRKIQEMSVITIPEGYAIEEMPESINMTLPNGKVIFAYQVRKLSENSIHVISNITIRTPIFLSEEYENLKAIYNRIIEEHKQQIILKKI